MKNFARALAAVMLLASTVIASFGAPAEAATGAAVYAFGQGTFASSGSAVTASGLNTPTASASDPVRHRAFIADNAANRVLVYNLNTDNSIPDKTADYVLGQGNFTSSGSATSQSGLKNPDEMYYDSTHDRLFVCDNGNHRVLVYDLSSISNGMNASYVIGQADFNSSAQATTQAGIWDAASVSMDKNDRYLFVADFTNRRVMVYDTNSIATGMGASYVLGQATYTSTTFAINQATTFFPSSVATDPATNTLYVAQETPHRVSAFDLNSLATNMNATYVIGQSNFTSNSSGTSKSLLTSPRGVAAGGGRVFVDDYGNHRALVFDATNTTNGQAAIAVYGQPDYTSNSVNNGGISATSLAYPNAVSFDPGTFRFFVTDSLNNRVLVYNAMSVESTVSAAVDPSLAFTVSTHAGACNGVSQSAGSSVSGTAVGLGRISLANGVGAQDVTVSTNGSGYTVSARYTSALGVIDDVSGTNASPAAFPSSGTEAFGYTTSDASLGTGTANRFTSGGAKWAALTTSNAEVSYGTGPVSSDTNCVAYQAQVASTTAAGAYSTTVIYTALPIF